MLPTVTGCGKVTTMFDASSVRSWPSPAQLVASSSSKAKATDGFVGVASWVAVKRAPCSETGPAFADIASMAMSAATVICIEEPPKFGR